MLRPPAPAGPHGPGLRSPTGLDPWERRRSLFAATIKSKQVRIMLGAGHENVQELLGVPTLAALLRSVADVSAP